MANKQRNKQLNEGTRNKTNKSGNKTNKESKERLANIRNTNRQSRKKMEAPKLMSAVLLLVFQCKPQSPFIYYYGDTKCAARTPEEDPDRDVFEMEPVLEPRPR